ncbi:MAG: methionine synthase [Pelolinea sp.]|nr:methionine synthase [Pelolinea sp.]
MISRKRERHPYLTTLQNRVVIFDGAMGTSLERQQLTPAHFGGQVLAGCNDHLNLTYPSAVEKVHRSFLEAGVDVIETNTFRSNRFTLKEFGLADKIHEINLSGAKLARRLADEYSTPGQPRFVAGSIGPTGILLSMGQSESAAGFDDVSAAFREQVMALTAGGVDLLLLETQQDILEVKAAILGIYQAFEANGKWLPIQAQVTLNANGRMLLGTDISAAMTILEGMGIDVIGINCSTGPEAMRGALGLLSRNSRLPISCLPNAGIPENINGKAVYPLSPADFAETMSTFSKEFGLNVVGGCCGTTPEHLRLLVNALKDQPNIKRSSTSVPRLASSFQAVEMHQVPAPLLIGERLNTQGSRLFKELMLKKEYSAAITIAREQIGNGAHALDVCTALTEDVAESERMAALIGLLSTQVDAPLVIDTTDPAVMEAALKAAPGRCLLNSIHLEVGDAKARRVLGLARDYNAAVIALTIDEYGMAKTAKDKLTVAQRIYSLAVDEFSLEAQDLIFDPLTFTLASGSPDTADAGLQTLEGIRLIKSSLPGVLTCLGVSNISFGLNPRARAILNSVFLYHTVQAGLDMAIINPAQVRPFAQIPAEERELAEALLFNRGARALSDFADYFLETKGSQPKEKRASLHDLPLEERIRQRILQQEKEGIIEDIDAYVHSVEDHQSKALELLNQALLPAMKKVGEQFARGELILPFVLQSAEVMRSATDHLETYLAKSGAQKKGRLVLATVYGDVHDIGKNLVKTILSNNGYEVVDLGKQVPVETIVTRAIKERANAIGLSALLVSTSQQMPLVVEELNRRGVSLPVLVGGAAVNQAFADRIRVLPDGSTYRGGVFYCKDAFDALKALEDHRLPESSISFPTSTEVNPEANEPKPSLPARQNTAVKIPEPPFWGHRIIDQIPLNELFSLLNRSALFRISWGTGNAKGEKWDKYQREFSSRLHAMRAVIDKNPWLTASALYGFFPCQSDGDDLVIFDKPLQDKNEITRFNLPRQTGGQRLCLSDSFSPRGSGRIDVAAFQIVTLGSPSTEYVHKFQAAGDITEAFYHHGLAVQLTETAAVWTHQRIRKELGLAARQGKRYSWGYPAIPDLSQHQLLFRLLPAEKALGIRLTSAYQFIPEYTTAALVVHHPDAAYFRME